MWLPSAAAASSLARLCVVAGAMAAGLGCVSTGPDVDSTHSSEHGRLIDAVFSATHNSYSGQRRGSLIAQFDSGVRLIELDIHDDDFASAGYRIGHDGPGDAVERGGDNPDSDRLTDWLAVVADWSRANPEHAPLVVVLDLKDSFADNESFAVGNLARLDAEIDAALGSRRVLAGDAGGSTSLADLRGRILTVLSGHTDSRLHYLRDRGLNPAVAANARGQIIELHDSGNQALWYWSGRLDGSEVEWRRHGRVDAGSDPALVIDDSGRVVEVHVGAGGKKLYYRTGRLADDGSLHWLIEPSQFPGGDEGAKPSLAIIGTEPLVVREIHESRRTGLRWQWTGRVDASGHIEWTRADDGRTDEDRYDEDTAVTPAGTISVWSVTTDPLGENILWCRSPGGTASYLRYPQRLFVEEQRGGPDAIGAAGSLFAAGEWDGTVQAKLFVESARERGQLVRLWGAEEDELWPAVNYLATDEPSADWYLRYLDQAGWVHY